MNLSPLKRLLLGITAVAVVWVSFQQHLPATYKTELAAKVSHNTIIQPLPKTVTTAATPASQSPPKKVVHKVAAKTSPKAQPAVTPSPSSNVSGLAPVPPSSASGGSSGSAGDTAVGYTSTNWSGYLSTRGNFTSVTGAWKATNALGISGITSADSTWIGIGGVTSGDLIQTGTMNLVDGSGAVTTAAFYEILPASAQIIDSMSVKPGDSMSASIDEIATDQWTITINDTSSGQSFTTTLSYHSSHSSAEWIEEDPSYSSHRLIPLDNFQTAHFTSAAATSSGASLSIAASNPLPITLVSAKGQVLGLPSSLSGGFSVSRLGL